MLLYTEKQLDEAYRIDCKARTQSDEAWVTREEFRPVYEMLIEHFMKAYESDALFMHEVPEHLLNSVNDLLKATLILEDK